jgi:hypothetical protein
MRFTARSGTGQALEPLPAQTNRTNSLSPWYEWKPRSCCGCWPVAARRLLYARAREPINLPRERHAGSSSAGTGSQSPQARAALAHAKIMSLQLICPSSTLALSAGQVRKEL